MARHPIIHGCLAYILEKKEFIMKNKPQVRLKSSNGKRKETLLAWLFLSPSLLGFIIFMFWPLVNTFYLSFFKWNMVSPTKSMVGIDNYISLLKDPGTIQIFTNTILYLVVLVLLNFLVPYILAFVNSFVIKKNQALFRGFIFMPSLISLVVGAIVFQWIFNPVSGPISAVLSNFGVTMPTWSKTSGLVIIVISLVATYKAFGYNFLVLTSGVSSVSSELVEAARLEKTPNRKIFTRIVAPLTSSSAIYILIMSIVQGLQYVFTPIKVLTQGGPDNASSNIIYKGYQEAFTFYDTGRSAALSVFTMIIFLVLLFIEFKYVEKGVYYEN